jgi:hypothetical protein
MLDSSIEYLYNNNNNKSQEIILNCKYQIKLLSFYLLSTFKQIETALEKSEELLNGIPKKKKNMNKDSSITSTNSETVNSEEKLEDFIESFKGIYNNENIGKYHWKIRVLKILKYKIKQIIRQGKTPIMTKYYGRSKVASQKPRFHGRFVKKSKI